MKVDFYHHNLTGEDSGKVANILASPMLSSGSVGREVEARLADFFNTPHALLTNSWTNGALAALLAARIGPGDEVIVPAMTFMATANIVELVGATPIIVDVEPGTYLMRAKDVALAITPRTRAVIPVHLYGQMCDMKAIKAALGARTDIRIFEDCAHCFEGERGGEKPGAHSDAAIFSFYATKNITCGEGGAIVTRDPALFDKLRETRTHGMTIGALDRFKTGSYAHYDMKQLGVKANLPDILAALLPHQIDQVYENLEKRETLAGVYSEGLAEFGVELLSRVQDTRNARHLFVIGVPADRRDALLIELGKSGIGATVNYRALHTLTYYREKYGFRPEDFPVSYAWGQSVIALPFYPSLTRSAQNHVIMSVTRCLQKNTEPVSPPHRAEMRPLETVE